ncbi:Fic family protein [Streptococcus uberis]|uniref:Fic family protein n=1 Tax=Streptococcus uberis TaxID=1349 RepID=UPI001939A92E|nr:Fic family protein [Streptococcus uberis]
MQTTYHIDNPNLPYETKRDLWQTGFGLQKVDGLVPSSHMVELAEKQARGEYSYLEVSDEITHYHETVDASTKEADLVALRIVELLSRNGFTFSPATLDYDFNQEKQFSYQGLSKEEMIAHIQNFISGIWQIHPFREGNTRTVTVFLIKYLREFGFTIDNQPFHENARYFRDALVLDNAKMLSKNSKYLNLFFENLLLDKKHALSSEEMYRELGLY